MLECSNAVDMMQHFLFKKKVDEDVTFCGYPRQVSNLERRLLSPKVEWLFWFGEPGALCGGVLRMKNQGNVRIIVCWRVLTMGNTLLSITITRYRHFGNGSSRRTGGRRKRRARFEALSDKRDMARWDETNSGDSLILRSFFICSLWFSNFIMMPKNGSSLVFYLFLFMVKYSILFLRRQGLGNRCGPWFWRARVTGIYLTIPGSDLAASRQLRRNRPGSESGCGIGELGLFTCNHTHWLAMPCHVAWEEGGFS